LGDGTGKAISGEFVCTAEGYDPGFVCAVKVVAVGDYDFCSVVVAADLKAGCEAG
jgi:hypothetical protein